MASAAGSGTGEGLPAKVISLTNTHSSRSMNWTVGVGPASDKPVMAITSWTPSTVAGPGWATPSTTMLSGAETPPAPELSA